MRKLSAKIEMDEETFAPLLILVLDGEATDATLQIEDMTDIKALHGEEGEQAFIDVTLEILSAYEALTDEEMQYYKANFKTLTRVTHKE